MTADEQGRSLRILIANERKVAEPVPLSPGDHLRVGKTVIQVRS